MSFEDKYRKRRQSILEPLAYKLRELLNDYCSELPRIDNISTRAKSVDRFIAKAKRTTEDDKTKYKDPLNEIQDQVGARIITFYLSDVPRVEEAVIKYFRPVEQQSLIPESENEFGYVGRHFILFIPADCFDESLCDVDAPKFFELQIKTLFQHAWSESNHDLAYKPTLAMSKHQKRLIAFTAAQAWGADEVFQQLYKDLSK